MDKIKPIKVLIYCPRLLDTGGIESHLKEFISSIHSENIQLILWIPDTRLNELNIKWYQENCYKTYFQNKSRLGVLQTILQIIKLNFAGINFFYSNGQGKSIFWIWKMLITIPNWIHHHHSSGDENDRKTWDASYMKALLYSNNLIVCSTNISKEVGQYLNRKVLSIPCYSRQIIIENKTIDKEKIKLAFVGRLIKEKGIDTISKLSNDLINSGIEFHIWGKEEFYNKKYFESYPNLQYHGSFNSLDGLKDVYDSIDGLILVSTHSEGLPISLLEAQAAGIPWIASEIGGISDLKTNDDINFLIPQNATYDEIKELILEFRKSLIEYKSLPVIENIKNYELHYSNATVSKLWKKIFYDFDKSPNR
jgi:glycosyltransferase involved in cell wall biosynthesis